MKLFILLCAFVLTTGLVSAEEKDDVLVEQSTESPIADIALVGDALKPHNLKADKETIKQLPGNSQTHTIADFIIHPLVALKPRVPETQKGKQADEGSTTPSPWQLFGFNAGQGLGSSVSSLAGSVTGWLGDRIQLPGLVDTPVREPSTTSTTTTTIRPDVIVRLQQRPSTRKPLISINNKNERPFRRYNQPNRYNYVNYVDDSEESDDSSEFNDYDNFDVKRKNRRRYQNYEEEDDEGEQNVSYENSENYEDGEESEELDNDNNSGEEQEPEDEEEVDERPFKTQNSDQNIGTKPDNLNRRQQQIYNQRKQTNQKQQRKKQLHEESIEEDQYDDEDDDQEFYYNTNQANTHSQNEFNFIQGGQQNLLKQIRQFTGGQTPAEIGNILNNAQKTNKRLQQATLLVKRNGQTVYVAPELLQIPQMNHPKVKASTNKPLSYHYPQAPLTMSHKRKSQPAQYITIPWKQLGMSHPNHLVSMAEDVQSQPLILSIPQGAIENMQKFGNNNKMPSMRGDAVPLLVEASIKDIFKPPRIPAARTPTKTPAVVIATKTKAGPALIRPATVVEKAPTVQEIKKREEKNRSPESSEDDQSAQFLVFADKPANTKLSRNAYRQILDYFNQNRSGRQLKDEKASVSQIEAGTKGQLIPVQIKTEDDELFKTEDQIFYDLKVTTESSVALENPKTVSDSTATSKNDQIKPNIEIETAL